MFAAPRMPNLRGFSAFWTVGGRTVACQFRWTKPKMDAIAYAVSKENLLACVSDDDFASDALCDFDLSRILCTERKSTTTVPELFSLSSVYEHEGETLVVSGRANEAL